MNKKHSLYFGVAILFLAAAFTLAGCDSGGDNDGGGTPTYVYTSSDAAGNTYILTVTGDSYELIIKDTNGNEQKSTGTAALGEGGTYTLAPSGNPEATIIVGTSGNGIGGIEGDITPDGGGDPIAPPEGPLNLAKTITITELAQYGVTGSAAVLLYENSSDLNAPIAAGYTTVQGNTAQAALKAISADDLVGVSQPESPAGVNSLIKDLPAWTGSGDYYVVLWGSPGMLRSINKISFTTANTSVSVLLDSSFYLLD
jgi:hypothetical protein